MRIGGENSSSTIRRRGRGAQGSPGQQPPGARERDGPLLQVWCGVVWCGVVWCGVVWCGVVWCAEGAVTKRQKAGMSTHGYR